MQTIELFAGTCSFSKVFGEHGYQTYTTDKYEVCPAIDLIEDVFNLTVFNLPRKPEILWASPPCEGFSVAAIGKSWNHDNTPKSDIARLGLRLVEETFRIIEDVQPKWWFIENPRGKLRKLPVMEQAPIRHTITYCQYGDTRMKPTDIWTNAHWWTPRPACKNGMPCHEAAPRGSKSGTQGMASYAEKSRIPPALFEEIVQQYEQFVELPAAA